MSLYPGFNKEKETSFLTLCMAKFGSTATSLFEIWTSAWSSDITSLFYKGIFFLFFTEWYSFFLLWAFFFFFLFFLPRNFFRSWFFRERRFFHKQRASTSDFLKCAMQARYGITCKWKSSLNVSGCRETPPGDLPRSEIMTPS